MKLWQLIKKIGEDKVETQSIATSVLKVQQKKHDAEITFATSKNNGHGIMQGLLPGGKCTRVGILVWCDREEYLKVMGEK